MDEVRRIIHPILKIISDTTKFEPINEDLMLLRGSQLLRLLRNRKASGHVDANIYSNIYLWTTGDALYKPLRPDSMPPFRRIVFLYREL